jgi:two-component system KDP operon response regulator KdpE
MVTILVVEDEPALRRTLVAALGSCGYDVVGAETGVEALDHVRRGRPDLVVLDLELPEMNGWEFLNHFRREHEHASVPVLVTSATHRHVEGRLAIQAFLAKPFDLDELLECVQALLCEPSDLQAAVDPDTAGAH